MRIIYGREICQIPGGEFFQRDLVHGAFRGDMACVTGSQGQGMEAPVAAAEADDPVLFYAQASQRQIETPSIGL